MVWGGSGMPKTMKHLLKIDANSMLEKGMQQIQKLSQNGPQWEPKSVQNPEKAGKKACQK